MSTVDKRLSGKGNLLTAGGALYFAAGLALAGCAYILTEIVRVIEKIIRKMRRL
ncbi:MAG: hypothetical protein LBG72_00240 [Spirochaetaceae bacterium]|nr:hypothetical protein [Spirochaetaceae bacterium]